MCFCEQAGLYCAPRGCTDIGLPHYTTIHVRNITVGRSEIQMRKSKSSKPIPPTVIVFAHSDAHAHVHLIQN